MKEHIWISSRGLRLSAMLHQPAEVRRYTPLIICCHGFTGDKVGANQLTLNLAKKLAQAGYNALRFDFLGSGDSEGEFATRFIAEGVAHRCRACGIVAVRQVHIERQVHGYAVHLA